MISDSEIDLVIELIIDFVIEQIIDFAIDSVIDFAICIASLCMRVSLAVRVAEMSERADAPRLSLTQVEKAREAIEFLSSLPIAPSGDRPSGSSVAGSGSYTSACIGFSAELRT